MQCSDYGSNFVSYLQARDRYGAEVVVIGDDHDGNLDMQALRREAEHEKARAICVSHIPTGGGRIIPAALIGDLAQEMGLVYFLDACQSVGMMRVDVKEIKCHVLTATGRKFLRGPRGTGLLFVDGGFVDQLEPCMLDQHGALLESETCFRPRAGAARFEMWEQNFAGKLALGLSHLI